MPNNNPTGRNQYSDGKGRGSATKQAGERARPPEPRGNPHTGARGPEPKQDAGRRSGGDR